MNDSPTNPYFVPASAAAYAANPFPIWLPGYDRTRRQILNEIDLAAREKSKADPIGHAKAEGFGGLSSFLGSMGAGAAIGALVPTSTYNGPLGGKFTVGRSTNAAVGAGVGAIVAAGAQLVAMLGAAVKRRRTEKEQLKSDEKSVAWKYLVPGLSTYDLFKRHGRALAEDGKII